MTACFGKQIAEYALILFLVALAAIPALSTLGSQFDARYSENPFGSAGALFGLLDARQAAPKPGIPAVNYGSGSGIPVFTQGGNEGYALSTNNPAVASRPSGSVNPAAHVTNVSFSYDPETGKVSVFVGDGTSRATEASSVEGTRALARNLAQLLNANLPNLSEQEQQELRTLSEIAFRIADHEENLLREYPAFETSPRSVPPIDGFMNGPLMDEIVQFNYRYNQVLKAMGSKQRDGGNLPEVRDAITANAAMISQLADQNFILAQSEQSTTWGENGSTGASDSYIIGKNTGINAIGDRPVSAAETPEVTRDAGNRMKTNGG